MIPTGLLTWCRPPGAGTIDIKSSESVPLWPLCRAARNDLPEPGAAGAQVILERM